MEEEKKFLSEKELQGYRFPVHVENWNKGCVFFYVSTTDGQHTITTRKHPKKTYVTSNRLYATRRNS